MLTAINTSKDIPVIATPRAVPAASVSFVPSTTPKVLKQAGIHAGEKKPATPTVAEAPGLKFGNRRFSVAPFNPRVC